MELTQLTSCAVCNGPLGSFFWQLKGSPASISPEMVNQVLGLTQMFRGNIIKLAEVFALDELVRIDGEENPELWMSIFVCHACWTAREVNLMNILAQG